MCKALSSPSDQGSSLWIRNGQAYTSAGVHVQEAMWHKSKMVAAGLRAGAAPGTAIWSLAAAAPSPIHELLIWEILYKAALPTALLEDKLTREQAHLFIIWSKNKTFLKLLTRTQIWRH